MKQNCEGSILLVEDHHDIANMLIEFFEAKNFVVNWASDGVLGLHLASTEPFDLILLDLTLPGIDGIQLCKNIREQLKIDTPIIMLTARDTVDDKLSGLNVGADDYVCKPFDIRELYARANALIRRYSGKLTYAVLKVGDVTIDTQTQRVLRNNTVLELTPTTYKILSYLMRASPRVVTRKELEHELWGDDSTDSDALRSHMYALRKVLDKPFEKPLLRTLSGRGFQLVSESIT